VAWFEFTPARFDNTSELPAEANAGNRFYGGDVAEFIADGLAGRGYSTAFLDEDWGWFVRARPANGSKLEIAIYHNIDEDPAFADGWQLSVEERARLGRKREPEEASVRALEAVFRDAGIELQPTER
jgi:hypothetical protein